MLAAAGMLRHALMERLRVIVDPARSMDTFYDEVVNLPSLDKTTSFIRAGQLDSIHNIVKLLTRRLRTVRDLIDAYSDTSQLLTKFSKGRLPTAENLPIPAIAQLYADVEAMERNFEEVIIGPQVIAVVTDDIVLNDSKHGDVNLGRLRIVLDLLVYAARERLPYRIGAVKPQYSHGGDGEYFHPHVSGNELCEGEAKHSIKRALDEGRFYDFFHIVHNTLTVYNPQSPHCALRLWFEPEESCPGCGDEIHEDEGCFCEQCENHVCDNCARYCEASSRYFCEDCVENGLDCDCSSLGAEGCLEHVNDECEICGMIPSDDEQDSCAAGRMFHSSCMYSATSLPDMCADCDNLLDCLAVPDRLKPEEEEEEPEDDDETTDAQSS